VLGSGAFGIVHKGSVRRGTIKTVIAIKTVNAPKDVEDFESSLIELFIMSYIGHHENIVSLVASCTDNLKKRTKPKMEITRKTVNNT
jgi:serine/threonine protein kinase